jgi:hypothetical protein
MSTVSKVQSFKNRIIAALLAALMVIGMSFAMPAAFADPVNPDTPPAVGVTPTGNEWIDSADTPTPNYICPRGGLYRFVGGDFVPNTTVNVYLKSSNALLGSFNIDSSGDIEPAIAGEPYAAVIIPEGTTPGADALVVLYDDATFACALEVTILDAPYSAYFEITGSSSALYLHVTNNTPGLWAPNLPVFFKIDYLEAPTYGPFYTDAVNGTFDEYIELPSSLAATGVHTFTLLAGDTTVGPTFYPRVSLSQNLTL